MKLSLIRNVGSTVKNGQETPIDVRRLHLNVLRNKGLSKEIIKKTLKYYIIFIIHLKIRVPLNI